MSVFVFVFASVFYTLDQYRGAACVNIGFPDDSTPGVPKHVGRKYCIDRV